MPGLPYELGVIFAVEFRRQIRSKGFMFFTVLIVVLMVGAIPITPIVVSLVDSATGGDESEVDTRESPSPRYGYVDPAGILPDDIVLEGGPKRYGGKDEGILAVRSGEIDTLFVLPADYIASGRIEDYWTTRERGAVWADNSDAERGFRAFLKRGLTSGLDLPDRVERAFDTGYMEEYDVPADASGVGESGAGFAQGLVELGAMMMFAVLLLFAVMMSGVTIIRSVSEEKETRMIELLITSASPMSILSGKLLAVVLAGLAHMAVWVLVGAFAVPAIFDQSTGRRRAGHIGSVAHHRRVLLRARLPPLLLALHVPGHLGELRRGGAAANEYTEHTRGHARLGNGADRERAGLAPAEGADLRAVLRSHAADGASGSGKRHVERRSCSGPRGRCRVRGGDDVACGARLQRGDPAVWPEPDQPAQPDRRPAAAGVGATQFRESKSLLAGGNRSLFVDDHLELAWSVVILPAVGEIPAPVFDVQNETVFAFFKIIGGGYYVA